MSNKLITSLRNTIEFLKKRNELIILQKEVDPIYEIAGIQKALEGGPAILFENIKGFSGVRDIGNVFSQNERTAALFDVAEPSKLKFKVLEAMKNPIPPKLVEDPPCQEVVITKNIDVMAILPLIKHSEEDAGQILGGGITLTAGLSSGKGTDLAFKRMFFRGKDWGSLHMTRGTHLSYARDIEFSGGRIPLTVNIGCGPAICAIAAGGGIHVVLPYGVDELGIAGALQGCPIEICRAKTVDAYAIANSEWVIEGYFLTSEPLWETEEAEKIGKRRVAPFLPEWAGYQGKATLDKKFQVTAITHREDRPIFYTPLAHSFELANMGHPLREACFYELADRNRPGLVTDVNIPWGMMGAGGVVYQVKKSVPEDDGHVKNILMAAAAVARIPMAIAVDEEVDIYSGDDILWAIWSRANHESGIFKGPRDSLIRGVVPAREPSLARGGMSEGALFIDATVPFAFRGIHKRIHYPVDKIDLKNWFSEDELALAQKSQCEYARLLARKGG